jgi:hypothetical protein
MNTRLISVCAGVLLLASGQLVAQDVSINFDTDTTGAAVAAGTDLTVAGTYVPWGVTFSRVGGSLCGPNVYANSNHPGDFGSLPNVVSTCPQGTASDINAIHGQVQASFSFTASQVCIDVRPDGETYYANLTAYDAADQVVDAQDSAVGVIQTLCVNGAGIAYVRFPGLGDTSTEYARFDNLAITTEEVAPTTSTFHVTKTFSDGNDAEVDVHLACNSGNPLEQDFTITGGDPVGVTFVVDNLPDTGTNCEVTETSGPAGYTPEFNGGDGCAWEGVLPNEEYSCEITNTADPASYTVLKDWTVYNDGGLPVEGVAGVTITCDSEIAGGWEDDGDWYLSGNLEDGDTLVATVDVTTGPATCSADEEIYQSGVESLADGCGPVPLGPGGSHTCVFTNTVFFEGIPTLSQWGLAILALLTLGVGLVGFRRFA